MHTPTEDFFTVTLSGVKVNSIANRILNAWGSRYQIEVRNTPFGSKNGWMRLTYSDYEFYIWR